MPHSTEIERVLLGAITADAGSGNAALLAAQQIGLAPKHFASDDWGRLYRVAVELTEAGTPPVLPLLYDTLIQRLSLDEAQRLLAMISQAATKDIEYVSAAPHFARRIIETWRRREGLRLSGDLAALCSEDPLDWEGYAQLLQRGQDLAVADSDRLDQLITPLSVLATQELPELHLIVTPLLPAGLTILGGRPKMGKSWLALNLGLSVASGSGAALGRFTSAESGRVLYLSLEDTKRRILDRASQCCAQDALPERMDIATEWPRLDQGGLGLIEQWLRAHTDRKLVICDTLAMIRPEPRDGEQANLYAADYLAVRQLKQLADRYDVAILVVHHLRKSPSADGDPVEELSGTYGLSGAADTVLVLKRQHGEEEGVLLGRGRDLEDIEWAMRFDRALGSWQAYGDASALAMTKERREVVEVLQINGPSTPKEISNLLGKSYPAIKMLVSRMARGNILSVAPDGKYSVAARSE